MTVEGDSALKLGFNRKDQLCAWQHTPNAPPHLHNTQRWNTHNQTNICKQLSLHVDTPLQSLFRVMVKAPVYV